MKNSKVIEIEERYKKKFTLYKIADVSIFIVSLILIIVLSVLYENSRTVTQIGPYENVSYDYTYLGWMVAPVIVAIYSFVLMIPIFCMKVNSIQVDNDWITIGRGFRNALFINGEYQEQEWGRWYLEGELSDRSVVTCSMSRFGMFIHLTFSNGHKAIDM